MKEKIAVILCFVILSLPALALIAPAEAVIPPPPTYHFEWVNPTYEGVDPYFGFYIVGYLENKNWNFTLSYRNTDLNPLNVSAIRVYFNWGKNYTHSFATPLQIMPSATQIFNVYNMTPATTEVSELWTHYYYVYIDRVNSTAPPYEQLDPILVTLGTNFTVLSADHLACLEVFTKLGISSVDGGSMLPWLPSTNITRVQVLIAQLRMELNQGLQSYWAGKFSNAKTYLQNTQDLYDELLNTLDDKGTAMEDATLTYKEAQTNYYNALGDSSKINACGWLLFGLGWMFIGLGLIIYAARKPKVVSS